MEEFPLRVVGAYGPQENALKEKKDKFWEAIEKEVNDAELDGDGLILQMDGNLHAGVDLVKGDPNKQNKNGKLFMEFLSRNSQLIVVNTLELCDGVITRKRTLEDKEEKAVMDFFIINEKMRPFIRKMLIDENKEYSLINLAQMKKNKRLIETDHNSLILDIELNAGGNKPEREEILNLRNKVCQKAFYNETEENQELLNCFENKLSLNVQSRRWKRTFDTILKKCFKKVRIKPKKVESKTEKLLTERVKLKKDAKATDMDEDMKDKIKQRIKQIEDDIGEDAVNENFKDVVDTLKDLEAEGNANGAGRNKLWRMLKKKFPKSASATPVGKKDNKGNLITNHKELKHLYLTTYKQRMRNRPMKT